MTTINTVKFSDILLSYTRAATAGDGAFNKLMMFAMAALATPEAAAMTHENKRNALEAVFKTEEMEYKKNAKDTAMPTAYRSGKAVVCKAVGLGVALVDDKGKAKGKTQLEKECKALEPGKPALEKFRVSCTTAFSLLNQMDNIEDVKSAKLLIAQLAEQCIKIEAAAAAGESIGHAPAMKEAA